MIFRRYISSTLFIALCATSLFAQRTADFRRLSLENGNAAQKSWLISDQSSLGIDANGTLTGTFPNINALVTLGAGTKTNALDLQSMLGGTGILFSQNIPSVGIDMFLGASGTGIIIDGGTPVGVTIGNVTAGSDGMTVDATNSGISIGNGTAPNNGMNIEAISTGLAIGTATTPDIGQTTEANLIGGTFDAGIIGVDIGQVNSPTLGLGVRSNGTGIDVNDVAFVGTGINVTMNNFFGTGLNIQDNTVSGTGINVSAGINSTGINVSGTTNNVLVVNGTADATSLDVANPVWDARINGDLRTSGLLYIGNIPALSAATNVIMTNAGMVEQRTAASLISDYAWALLGNAGTVPGTNFAGTTDNVAYHINVRNGANINNSLIFGTNGSLSREITGVTAGNARGTHAVDLQLQRNVATEVASGGGSFIGAGANNRASNTYAAVVAGQGNDATNQFSFVGGGENNQATGIWSVIGGGNGNTASSNETFVGSGTSVQATGFRAAVVGGIANTASGAHSFIGGGGQFGVTTSANIASGNTSTIGGGRGNRATDDFAFIGGGDANQAGDNAGTTADRQYATVSGGLQNTASGIASTVGGGRLNSVQGNYSTASGGSYNQVLFDNSFVGGGRGNQNFGIGSVIVGGDGGSDAYGSNNKINAPEAFIGGGFRNENYGDFSVIVGGEQNLIASNAFDGAGHNVIVGGQFNQAGGDNTGGAILSGMNFVGGGHNNRAYGGIALNQSTGMNAVICGDQNWVTGGTGQFSGLNFIGGGYINTITGGSGNLAGGNFIGGGYFNDANGTATLASGANVVAGGWDNNAIPAPGTIGKISMGGGQFNNATGSMSTIAGGNQGTASGVGSVISGGGYDGTTFDGNAATGNASVVAGGIGNTASGNYSAVTSGRNAIATHYGETAHASGSFAADGDAQAFTVVMRNESAGAGVVTLFLDGAASRLTIPDRTSWNAEISISGRGNTGGLVGSANFIVSIVRGVGAGTTALQGPVTTLHDQFTAAGAAMTITADNVNGALNITCANVIPFDPNTRWVATVRVTQVTF